MAKLYNLKGIVALALLNLGVCNSPDSIVQEKYAPVSSQYSVQEEKAPEEKEKNGPEKSGQKDDQKSEQKSRKRSS